MLKKGESNVLRTSVKVSNIENHDHVKEQVLHSAVTVDYPRERKPSLRRDRTRFNDPRIKLVALLRANPEARFFDVTSFKSVDCHSRVVARIENATAITKNYRWMRHGVAVNASLGII